MKGNTKALLKKIVKLPFNAIGFDMVKSKTAVSWEKRMELAKQLGFSPQVILAGGAYRELWSLKAAGLFPRAQIIVIGI